MAEARLGPDELDRLEDALEGLERLTDLRDPSDAVSSRLADFQLILQASREALPLEEVRPGLLDGVIAEARMSPQDIQAPVVEPPPTPSFWARLRGAWLVPGLAVAGSAALVLILVKPMASSKRAPEESEAVAMKDAPRPSPGSEMREDSVAAPAQARAELSAAEEKPVAGQVDSATEAPPPADAAPAGPASSIGKIVPAAPEPESEPESESDLVREVDKKAEPSPAAAADATKQDASGKGWNAIEQGDAARDGGDCFSARNHYARALDDGNDSVRARAYVGMGLCKRKSGDDAAADEYFDKARELDEDAVEFADTRTKDSPAKPSSRRPKKPRSRKRKSAMDFDEAADPLSGM